MEELCPNSDILDGFSIKGGIERDVVFLAIKGQKSAEAEKRVIEWLGKVGVLN